MDIESLIVPLSEEFGAKAGEDLSYSDDRTTIEAPFQLDANGDAVDERGWRDSIKLILEQATQTRDIWLATYLARAGAKVGDLQMVADGTEMMARLFETLWDEVHPTLDEADFVGRKTPCDSLTRIREFLAPLRRVAVFTYRDSKFSGEDLERFAAQGASADGYAQFRGMMDQAEKNEEGSVKATFEQAVAQLDGIRAALSRVDAVLVAHAGSETGTNFDPTYAVLDAIRLAALPYAGIEPEPEAAAGTDPLESGSTAGGGGPALSGRVNNREDVTRAIDAIVEYYRAREPGHPMPVLMKRARHWVAMDFLELIDEIVPDSAPDARKVLVSKKDEPQDETSY